jgi:hypothetical protein
MKVADIKLTWKRSVSTDVKRVEMKLVIDVCYFHPEPFLDLSSRTMRRADTWTVAIS